MTEIRITSSSDIREHRPSNDATSSGQANINQKTAWAIVVILALVPLPFGSVYGASWAAFAALTGLLTTVYALALARAGQSWRYPLRQLKVATAIFLGLLTYLIVQILPIGPLFGPISLVTHGARTVASNTISVASDMTFLMLMRQLCYGLFFFLVLQISVNDTRRRFLLDAILVIIVFYGVFAIVSLQMDDTVLGFIKKAYQGSATGPFINRNSFATFVGFGSLIALAQIGRRIVDQAQRHRDDGRVVGNSSAIALYAIAYVLLISVLVATQSRMGLAASLTAH